MDRHNLQRRSSALKSDLGSFNAPVNRAVRAETRLRERRLMRDSNFSRHRNLPDVVEELEPPVQPPVDRRRTRLEKWKKDKEAAKLKAKLKKKPEFKCGSIHYKDSDVYREYDAHRGHITKILPLCPTANYQFKAPKGLLALKITVPKSPMVLSRSVKKQLDIREATSTQKSPNIRITRAMRQKMETKALQSIPEAVVSLPKLPRNRKLNFPAVSTSTPVAGTSTVTPVSSKWSTRSHAITPASSIRSKRPQAMTPASSRRSPKTQARAPLSTLISIKSSTVTSVSTSKSVKNEVLLPWNAASTSQQAPTNSPSKETIAFSQESASITPQTLNDATSKEPISSSQKAAEAQESTITPTKEVEHSIVNSPFLTYTRGKQRRSSQAPEPSDDRDEQARSATYFSNILCDEIRRMQNLCEEWTSRQAEQEALIPNEVNELIDLAVGRTKLLLSQKMKQFGNLVGLFAKGTVKPKIIVSDLQGFWDMMYLQVENIDMQFNKLSTLHANDWKDEEKEAETEHVKLKPTNRVKRVGVKDKVKSKSRSMLRVAIDAARKSRTHLKENDPPTSNDDPEIPNLAVILERHSFLRVSEGSPVKVPPISPVVLRVSQMVKAIGSPLEMTENENLSTQSSPVRGILRIKKTPHKSAVVKEDETSELEEDAPFFTPMTRRSIRRQSTRLSMKRVQFDGTSSNSENATPKKSLPVTPFKIRRNQGPSLLPCTEEGIPTTPLPSGDLISFESPQSNRRSLRTTQRL